MTPLALGKTRKLRRQNKIKADRSGTRGYARDGEKVVKALRAQARRIFSLLSSPRIVVDADEETNDDRAGCHADKYAKNPHKCEFTESIGRDREKRL